MRSMSWLLGHRPHCLLIKKISSKHKRSDSNLQEEPFKRCIFPKILSTGFHKSERQAWFLQASWKIGTKKTLAYRKCCRIGTCVEGCQWRIQRVEIKLSLPDPSWCLERLGWDGRGITIDSGITKHTKKSFNINASSINTQLTYQIWI